MELFKSPGISDFVSQNGREIPIYLEVNWLKPPHFLFFLISIFFPSISACVLLDEVHQTTCTSCAAWYLLVREDTRQHGLYARRDPMTNQVVVA